MEKEFRERRELDMIMEPILNQFLTKYYKKHPEQCYQDIDFHHLIPYAEENEGWTPPKEIHGKLMEMCPQIQMKFINKK